MPRFSPDMPRQMFPPPMTTAISTPRSRRAASISSAMRDTTAASMWCPVAEFSNASPESFSTTRWKRPDTMTAKLLLAGLDPREAAQRGTRTEAFDELADRDLRVLHGTLLEQHDVFVEGVQPTGGGTGELVFGHAFVAALRLDDRPLAI